MTRGGAYRFHALGILRERLRFEVVREGDPIKRKSSSHFDPAPLNRAISSSSGGISALASLKIEIKSRADLAFSVVK